MTCFTGSPLTFALGNPPSYEGHLGGMAEMILLWEKMYVMKPFLLTLSGSEITKYLSDLPVIGR